MRPIAVYLCKGNTLENSFLELIPHRSNLGRFMFQILSGEFARLPQAHGKNDVFCASTTPRFMPGTVDEWLQRAASAHIESPNTLGGVDFMTGNGQKINAQFIYQRGDFADGLCRILSLIHI